MSDELKQEAVSEVKEEVKDSKKKKEFKIVSERVYNIPLRRDFVKTACYKRSKKAINLIKEFIMKHMKSDNVKISGELNEFVWSKGIKNPPSKVKVKAFKDETGKVNVVLEK